MRNLCPCEGVDVVISLPVITCITIFVNEKPAWATAWAVQSSSEAVAKGCSVILRQCPKWIKQGRTAYQYFPHLKPICLLIPFGSGTSY